MSDQKKKTLPAAKSLKPFLETQFPESETFIDGMLYRRDLVAIQGRRREGKTTLIMQLALSLTVDPSVPFLGKKVIKPRRVLVYLLEDDAKQLQDRFRRMLTGNEGEDDEWKEYLNDEGRLLIRTKDDFVQGGIPRNALSKEFQQAIEEDCATFRPDAVIFDNLGILIGADYTEHTKIAEYTRFIEFLSNKYDCTVLTATHLRKIDRNKPTNIVKDGDGFFEEAIGSSHFMNTCGSMWGLQKSKEEDGTTYFRGGAQRRHGFSQLIPLHLKHDWFEQANDFLASFELVIRTEKRKKAWAVLPSQFTFTQGAAAVRGVMSEKAFANLWVELKNLRLILPDGDGVFRKAKMEDDRS
jgi:RecA-family ATPase